MNLRQLITTAVQLSLKLSKSFQGRIVYTYVSICRQSPYKDENSSTERMQASECCIKDVDDLIGLTELQHNSFNKSYNEQSDKETTVYIDKLNKSLIDIVLECLIVLHKLDYFRDLGYNVCFYVW